MQGLAGPAAVGHHSIRKAPGRAGPRMARGTSIGSSCFGKLLIVRMMGMCKPVLRVWVARAGRSGGAAMAREIRISRVFHQVQLEVLPVGMGTCVHLRQVQAVEVVRPDQGVGARVRENDARADC